MTEAAPARRPLASRLWSKVTDTARRPGSRRLVRAFTKLHAWVYRVTGGRAAVRRYPTLVLTVNGRKSGQPRTAPLVYIRDGDDLIVAAAYSGAETNPTWWLNLKAAGEGTVQVGKRVTTVDAVEVDDAEREQLWARLVAMYPPFTEYETRTARVFPIVRLRPRQHAPH